MNSKASPVTATNWGLFLGIILVSFCLRPSLTGVGPLVPQIRADLNLSNAWAGFLTTLPLVTFAGFSMISSSVGNKLGNERAIFLGLIILAVGLYIRVQGGMFLLYFGTGLTGIGIVICNVLLIPLIKAKMPHIIGLMTSTYTTGLSLFAAVGTGVTIPLANEFGWRGSLLFWLLLVVLTLICWIPRIKSTGRPLKAVDAGGGSNIWKSRLAWQVSMFMGLQSFMFYTLIAWLPDMLISKGFSAANAGLTVSLMQVVGLGGTFLAPLVALKLKEQTIISMGLGIGYVLGFSSFFSASIGLIYLGLAMVGFCLGASISMAYILIGLRTREKNTASLSGMSQSVGYFLAATGPLLVGVIFDISVNWNLFIGILILAGVAFTYLGSKVGRDRKV